MTDETQQSPAAIQHRVLLVEDDEVTRHFLEAALSGFFLVRIAQTADEALAAVEHASRAFDLFMLDISLRGGPGGVSILKTLRQMDLYRATPAIAMTAYDPETAPENFMEAGFDAYLQKPFYQQDLLDQIEKLLAPNAE